MLLINFLEEQYNEKCDVYSYSIITWEIFTRKRRIFKTIFGIFFLFNWKNNRFYLLAYFHLIEPTTGQIIYWVTEGKWAKFTNIFELRNIFEFFSKFKEKFVQNQFQSVLRFWKSFLYMESIEIRLIGQACN